MKIYGTPASRAVRTLWIAHELGLAYENIPYSFKGPEIKQPPFLALNPNGAIPVIDDGGFVLWESMAINLYLAKKHGKGLWPATLEDEARVYQWTLWAANEIEPRIGGWFYHTRMLPEEQRIPAIAAKALAELPPRFKVLDAHVAGRQWLVGDRFSVADLNVAAAMLRAPEIGLADTPALSAWLERSTARPAARAALALREQAMKAS